MKYEEFSKNTNVINFIKKIIDEHFPQKYIPEWVNYELFKNYMIKQAIYNLYKDINSLYWWTELLLPYTSCKLDMSSSVVCSIYENIDYVPEIPENIKSLLLT
jgi:hypothetical protein